MPEHLKKYINRRINPSYFTDYDKTYISSYTFLLVPKKYKKDHLLFYGKWPFHFHIQFYDVITLYLCFNAFDSATFVNGTI